MQGTGYLATEIGAIAGGGLCTFAMWALVAPHLDRTGDTVSSLGIFLVLVLLLGATLALSAGLGAFAALRWRGHPAAGSTGTLVAFGSVFVAVLPQATLVLAPVTPLVARYFALRAAPPPA